VDTPNAEKEPRYYVSVGAETWDIRDSTGQVPLFGRLGPDDYRGTIGRLVESFPFYDDSFSSSSGKVAADARCAELNDAQNGREQNNGRL
jgi:hypothetical protein